jgi:hypothetical protein
VIIDIGVETYTARTFSADRYSLWTMQSGYHNLPAIGGVSQHEGREFAARDVRYEANDVRASLSMDIAGAYPPEARLKSWQRTLTLVRGREVTVRDAYELLPNANGSGSDARPSIGSSPITLTLMTCREPDINTPGKIFLPFRGERKGGTTAEVSYDPALFLIHVEPIDIQDRQLQASWGTKIWRIILTMKQVSQKNDYLIRIM